jgi:recombination protein RecA
MAKTKQTEEGVEKDSVQKLLEQLNKDFGKGTVISGKNVSIVKSVPTGSITLDIATNIKGLPVGKLIEIFGPESSGKSTLTMHFIAEQQKAGKKCMLVDAEHSFDAKYAANLGVNVDDIIYCQPDCMEDAYNIMETSIKAGILGLIVFDSHTASQPKKIVDGEVGDATMALQARINSTALAKLHPLLDTYGVTLVGISQLRQNIGGYGDPNVTTGGLAWKFYSDMRMKVSKKIDKTGSSNRTIVEIIKNKCGVPFGKAEFSIIWGQGIDRQQELIDLAVEYGFLKLGGAGWYTINEETKIQGDDKLKVFLLDNPEYAKELEDKVMNNIKVTHESKSEETDSGSSDS